MSGRHLDRMPTYDLAKLVSFARGDVSDRAPGSWAQTGTLVGGASVSSGSLLLSGSAQYLSFPDAAHLDMPSAFSMTCWFEPSTPGSASRTICGKYNSTGNNRSYYIVAGYAVSYWDIVISATGGALSGSTALNYRFTQTIPTSGWHHVGCVVDTNAASGSRVRLWIDGAELAETIVQDHSGFTPFNNANALEIGSLGGGASAWKGNLDDFRLYRRALSSAEVGAIYSSGRQ